MDIIILFLLLGTGIAIWRGAPRTVIIAGWALGFVLMAGLFNYHLSSSLGLSF